MKKLIIWLFIFSPSIFYGQEKTICIPFANKTFNACVTQNNSIDFTDTLSQKTILKFAAEISQSNYQDLIAALKIFRTENKLDDWFYYQLIRKAAGNLYPKEKNYISYTIMKWYLLTHLGFDAQLAAGKEQIILYIRSDDEIFDIPLYRNSGKQYVCLNYHDYGKLLYEQSPIFPVEMPVEGATQKFSYHINEIPDFEPENYQEEKLAFNFREREYHFNILLNSELKQLFKNYPEVPFESYFNIPLSRQTYSSLIPLLKKYISGMSQKKGVDYLMRFTRYAFLYVDDVENFGKERRLSPEQTLLYNHSDCDDRAGLFFYLIKEIYNLPMIAMLYPTHITMAVNFDKENPKGIEYEGKKFTVCEPTPQLQNLKIGQLSSVLKFQPYQVVYYYNPVSK